MVIFVVASTVTIAAFLATRNQSHRTLEAEFVAAARERAVAIERSVWDRLVILESIHAMYSSAGDPRPEFRALVEPIISEMHGIQSLEWVVRVTNEQRDGFEAARRREGIAGYQITERRAQGVMVRASERDDYYTVFPIMPIDPGDASVGFDLGSNPQRRQALEQARDSGRTVASARVTLVQEGEEGQFGFLMFAPVYDTREPPTTVQDRRELLQGFATGVFRLGDMIEEALEIFEPAGVDIFVYDESAPETDRSLFARVPSTTPDLNSEANELPTHGPTDYVYSLELGGRTWSVVAAATPVFMASHTDTIAWLVLAAGLAFTALLTTYLTATASHTARMQSAAGALAKANEELEERVAERTADLDAFVRSAAHDLQAPVRAVSGFSQLLMDDYGKNMDRGEAKYVELISSSAKRMEALIRDLLDYSRLRREHLQLQAVHLEEVVEQVGLSLANDLDQRGVEFVVECSSPAVKAEPAVLSQVVENLVSNAVKFSQPDKTPRVAVRAENRKGSVRLWIEDNGIGIAEEYHERIFGVFERLHDQESYEGTGIGLAIVRRGVTRMGGLVGVESKVGEGSRFWIELPVH